MRIVVDVMMTRAVPELSGLIRDLGGDSAFGVFDASVSPERILEIVVRVRPEVVVVDPSWTAVSFLLARCLSDGGSPTARLALGAAAIDDTLRIHASRSGFVDIVDVTRPAPDVLDHILRIAAGESQLRDNRLWTTIDRSSPSTDVTEAMSDRLDHDILELLSVGLSDREIAAGVHLSLQAVRNRVSAMLERSGCVNRTQLGWMYTARKSVDVLMADLGARPSADVRPERPRDGTPP